MFLMSGGHWGANILDQGVRQERWPGIIKRAWLLLLLLLSHFSRVQLCATPWTEAHQAPPSMGFSRQEYWSGVPLPSPGRKTETWINGMELRAQNYVDNSYLTKKQIIYTGERIVSLTNSVGKTGPPHTKRERKKRKEIIDHCLTP